MRRYFVFVVVLAISLSISPRTKAYSQDCTEVNCGCRCHVGGSIDGYCNPPAPDYIGCVQLYGPDCASMETSCCKSTGTAASF